MILVGSQRGGAKDLALHLMKDENDHVTVHDIRGFASDDLMGALNEAYAVSKGTKCKKFLYSLSLNPPPNETVETGTFETAIGRIEDKLGLTDQPRAIVFHEKEGRRHAHAVWSRIDTEQMKAVQISHDYPKLQTVARELYIEHGWKMPHGFIDKNNRDPRNYTLAEWQQAKRVDKHPHEIKRAIADAWAVSDSKASFEHALQDQGYKLARGDRRGFVAVDMHGEAYPIRQHVGKKINAIRERLGEEDTFPSVDDTKARYADEMLSTLGRFQKQLGEQEQRKQEEFETAKADLITRQREDRAEQTLQFEQRQLDEARERQNRFRTGIAGLWDRLRGEHKRIRLENERDAQEAIARDSTEREKLVQQQIEERNQFTMRQANEHRRLQEQQQNLSQDAEKFEQMKPPELELDVQTKNESPQIPDQQSHGLQEPEPIERTKPPEPTPVQAIDAERQAYIEQRKASLEQNQIRTPTRDPTLER
ncbi:MAG: relaxase [Pseudomonadota bacterium]